MNNQPLFDHEKLDVYQVELAFVGWTTALLKEVKASAEAPFGEACDQLDRASLSALLNTAEGNGKRQTKQRAKFFDDARGSAVECAACLDAFVAKGLVTRERIFDGKTMLVRIVGMLTKLVERFDDDSYRLRDGDDQEYLPRASISSSSSNGEQNEDEGREREGGRG